VPRIGIFVLGLLASSASAWAEDGASLAGYQLTGWDMMTGGADRTEVLAFNPDGALTLAIEGQPTILGSWTTNNDGAYCVSLPDIAACFEPDIQGTRIAIVLNNEEGQLAHMWTGDLSPIP